MLLFVKSPDVNVGQIIVPLSRVYDIWVVGCHININYDAGDMIEIVDGVYHKKVDTVSAIYSSPEVANKVLRQFYKACNNHSSAFFFGGDD